MKTFTNLKFTKHSNSWGFDTQATMEFKNGYGVSVITGNSAYGSGNSPYEVAVLYKGALTYNTPITDDVIGHNTKRDVTEIMKKVQLLKKQL